MAVRDPCALKALKTPQLRLPEDDESAVDGAVETSSDHSYTTATQAPQFWTLEEDEPSVYESDKKSRERYATPTPQAQNPSQQLDSHLKAHPDPDLMSIQSLLGIRLRTGA